MTKPKLISFDLQGTLSESSFSNEFWLELLPALYAKQQGVSTQEAKELLELEYQSTGKYHELFYNHRLRLDAILPNWTFQEVIGMLNNKPRIDLDVLNIIKSIPNQIPKIIFSATTRDFIDLELGEAKTHFLASFSAIDDFETAGKTPALYQKIATMMTLNPQDCLHIGDCHEMDYENAKDAGWNSHHLNKKLSRTEYLLGLEKSLKHFLGKMALS